MKIDEKKYFTLSELINYIFKNKIKDARYYSESGSYIDVKDYRLVSTVDILPNDRFLVKYTVYSDLTLDTKISYFLEKDVYYNYREHQNKAINDLLFLNTTAQIWLINKDHTHTLIWEYGKLIK